MLIGFCAACSLPTLRSTASAIAACQGQCSIERQTLITVRPRSANTRCFSETAAALSGMNCKPCWQTTQSKVASANAMSVALPTRHSIAAAVSREARAREHARVEIEADNLSCRTDPICYESGHNTGAARDVQHAIARFDGGEFHKSARVRKT